MRLRTDDDIYRARLLFLGPKGFTLPVHLPYVAYPLFVGVLATIILLGLSGQCCLAQPVDVPDARHVGRGHVGEVALEVADDAVDLDPGVLVDDRRRALAQGVLGDVEGHVAAQRPDVRDRARRQRHVRQP